MKPVIRMGEHRLWNWRDWLSAGVLAGLAAFVVGFLYYQRNYVDVLASLHIGELAWIVTLSAASLFLVGVAQCLLFRRSARKLRLCESVQIAISLNFLNYLPAKAGLLGRGAYLNRVHQVAVKDYVGLTVRSKLIMLSATCGVAAITGFISASDGNDPRAWLATGLALIAIASVAMYIYGPWVIVASGKLPFFRQLIKRFPYQREALGVASVVQFSGLVTAAMLCRAGRLYVIASALGYPLDPAAVIVIQGATGLIGVIAILPGNLGVRDASLATLVAAFGVPWQMVVLIVLLDRLGTMVVPFAIGPWVTHRLSRRMLTRDSGTGP